MRGLFKNRLGLVFATGMLGIAAVSANADPVEFYTTGDFGTGTFSGGSISFVHGASGPLPSPSYGAGDVSSVTVDDPVNGLTSTLTYHYSGDENVFLIDGIGNVNGSLSFGSFDVSSNGPSTGGTNTDAFNGISFSLSIFQLQPGMDNGSLVGTLGGKLMAVTHADGSTATGSPGSTVSLAFVPNTLTLADGLITYTIDPPSNGTILIGGGTNQVTPIEGTISEAPLPATASMGLGLFGVIGAAGVLNSLRRRRMAAL